VSDLLLCPEGCEGCGRPFALLGKTVVGLLCSDCYQKKGCPLGASLGNVHEMEENTRKRMMQRGSEFAHLVRKGLT